VAARGESGAVGGRFGGDRARFGVEKLESAVESTTVRSIRHLQRSIWRRRSSNRGTGRGRSTWRRPGAAHDGEEEPAATPAMSWTSPARWAPRTSTPNLQWAARGQSSSSSSPTTVSSISSSPPPSSSPGLFLLPRHRAASLFLLSQLSHLRSPPHRLAALVGARRPVRALLPGLPPRHTVPAIVGDGVKCPLLLLLCTLYAKGLLPLQNAIYCWSQPYTV
jgi:hypothetical protein